MIKSKLIANKAEIAGMLNAKKDSTVAILEEVKITGTTNLEKSTMEAGKLQVEQTGQVNVNDESKLIANKAEIAGTLNAKKASTVAILEEVKITGTANLEKSTMEAGKLQVEQSGQVNVNDESKLIANKAEIAGTLNAKKALTVAILEEVKITGTANLEKSTMEAGKLQVEQSGQVNVNDESKLIANKAEVAGTLNAKKASTVAILEEVKITGTANLEKSTMEAGKLQVEQSGQVNVNDESKLIANKAEIAGTLNAKKALTVAILEEVKITGTANLEKSTMEAGKLQVEQSGQVNVNDQSKLIANKAEVAGTLNAKKDATVTIIEEGKISGTANLEKSTLEAGKLQVEKSGQVNVNDESKLIANKADVAGTLNAKKDSTVTIIEEGKISGTANLEKSTMGAGKLLVEKSGQVNVNDESKLIANKADVAGTLNAKKDATVTIIEEGKISGTANLEKSTLEAGKLQVEKSGQVNVNDESKLIANKAEVAGTLNAKKDATVTIIEEGKISGTANLEKSTMGAGKLLVEKSGQVNVNDESKLIANKAEVAGTLNAKKDSTVAILEEGIISGTTNLEKSTMIAKKLHIEKTGQVQANAESTLHTGAANIDGKLNVDNASTFKVDQKVVISGEVNVNQARMIVNDKLDLNKSASLTLTQNSYLEGGDTLNEGIIKSEDSHIKLKQYQSTETSTTQLHSSDHLKPTTFIADGEIKMQGQVDTKNTFIKSGTSVDLGKKTNIVMDTTCIEANKIQISSQVTAIGNNALLAKEHLTTDVNSKITGSGSVSFKAPKASLAGAFDANNAIVEIDQLDANIHDLIYGTKSYKNFQPKGMLSITTPESIHFNQALNKQCKLELTAKDINVNSTMKMMKGLYFESTQGNVNINADIQMQETSHIKSAQHILNHNARVVSEQQLYLETVKGNLNNIGGVFQGKTYLQGKINGDVNNSSIETIVQGKYDKIKQYKPAQLIGGKWTEDHIGLFMQVEGKFINDSIIQSQGHNVIHARKGYQGKSHTHSYISEKNKDHGWFSGSDKEVSTTDVFTSKMLSTDGRNIVKVEEGGIISDASSFITKDGTDLFARDNIDLLGVKTTQKINENSYSWFGISNSHKKETHESITPTLIFDLDRSNIHSYKGDINALDAKIVGPGHFYTKANNIHMSSGIEKHSVRSHTQSLSIDAFGLSAIRAIVSGDNVVSPLMQQDTTTSKLNTLVNQSNNYAELGVNTWNTAISAYNTYQTLNAAHQTNTLGSALLQRYNLGNSSGFNPTISLTFTDTQSLFNYESSGLSGVFRGSWEVDANNQFIIEDCPVDIKDNMSVKAKTFSLKANPHNSNYSSQSVSGSVGVTLKGDALSLGFGYQQQEGTQSVYNTQVLRVGNNLELKDVKTWKMDHALCDVNAINGNVNELVMTSRLNKQSSSGFSIHAATSGLMGGSYSNDNSETLSQKSAIIVRNSQGSNLKVDHAELNGSEIHAQKYNDIQIGKMITNTVTEKATGGHYGIFGNLMDVLPKQKSSEFTSADQFPKPLPLMNVQFGERSYLAHNNSGMSSLNHNSAPKEQLLWNVNNDGKLGKKILLDSNLNLQIDIPMAVPPLNNMRERFSLPALSKSDRKTNHSSNDQTDKKLKQQNTIVISGSEIENHDAKSDQPVINKVKKNVYADVDLVESPSLKLKTRSISSKSDEELPPPTSNSEFSEVSTDAQSHNENLAQEAAILALNKDKSFHQKYKYSYPKMKTSDVKLGTKNNKNGDQQLYDISNGQFINGEGVCEKIKEKNKKRDGISNEFKFAFKKEFIKPEERIHWQAGDENSLIRPTIVDDSGRGFFAAEYDPTKQQLKIKLESGRDLRVNLTEQVHDIGELGQSHLAVDAASIHALMRVSASNERGMNLEACGEVGVLGPSVNGTLKSAEICLFGLSFSCDAAIRTGFGAKGALGGGLTLDKTKFQFRPYAKVGGYLGAGAETEIKVNVGIDTEMNKRMSGNFDQLAEIPMNKRVLQGSQECIQEIEKENPTTILGKLWKQYRLDCYREVLEDKIEGMGQQAAAGGLFAIRKPKSEPTIYEKDNMTNNNQNSSEVNRRIK